MKQHLILLLLSLPSPWTTQASVLIGVNVSYFRDIGNHFACVTMDWSNLDDNILVLTLSKLGGLKISIQGFRSVQFATESQSPLPRLSNALRALGPVTLRVGGTQADNITYAVGEDRAIECPDFSPQPPENSSNFHGGCLTQQRWNQLLDFCSPDQDCRIVFGLNLMNGRNREDVYYADPCPGNWDPSNAKALIEYTASLDFPIFGYELGNEIECLNATQYALDTMTLRGIIDEVFQSGQLDRPKIIVTDQLEWEQRFFDEFVPLVKNIADGITWHNYPLGPGYGNPYLEKEIMSPKFHEIFASKARRAYETVRGKSNGKLEAWMGETGGAYNSGHNTTSNRFIDAFWFVEALGAFAHSGHSSFCRQSFLGGNYELVDKSTLRPNPDYFGLALFNRLMGSQVFETTMDSGDSRETENIRSWVHCTRSSYNASFDPSSPAYLSILVLNYANTSSVLDLPESPITKSYDVFIVTAEELHSSTISVNGIEMVNTDPNDTKIPLPEAKVAFGPMTLPGQSYSFVVLRADSVEGAEEVCLGMK